MILHFPEATSFISFVPSGTPSDLNAARGIGVGVVLGVVAWIAIIAIIAVGVAVMSWS
jgi:hypothetical protein